MAYFNNRERKQLGTPPTARDGVDDYARRPQQKAGIQLISGEMSALLQAATDTSIQEIDSVIAGLTAMREMLSSEAARLEREMDNFTSLGQSAVDSAKVISESLEKSFPSLRVQKEPFLTKDQVS
jgi:hypothetical protein